ncbi:MAG: septation protein SpoVG family protein [Monoglobus pectinilyticus]|uniref:septation protein SpoVG family protein n=1 Tax=Monoglobus pectinilyticus TaxID=1981510 RepID=UPI003996BC41
MNVTEVKFREYGQRSVVGFADVTLDGELVVKDIIVRKSKNGDGLAIFFPSKLGKDNKYYDIVFPITKTAREIIKTAITEKIGK